jgi:hypothetical protein
MSATTRFITGGHRSAQERLDTKLIKFDPFPDKHKCGYWKPDTRKLENKGTQTPGN